MTTPLTLLRGGEALLVDRAIAGLVAEARKVDPSAARTDIDAVPESAAFDLAEALSPTLFGEPSVVVVTGAEELDDGALAVLRGFVADPTPGVHLVVVHAGGAKGKAVLALAKEAGAAEVACALVRGRGAFTGFAIQEARRHHRRLAPEAATAIHEAIGDDLRLLAAAVSQVCSDVEGDPIEAEQVRRYVAGVAGTAGWDVSDAVWGRRPVDALRHLRWIMETGGRFASPPVIVGAVAGGLRTVVRVQGLPGGMDDAAAAREVGAHPFKVKTARGFARTWSQGRLAAATVHLAALDVAVKGGMREGSALDEDQKEYALETFVIDTATRPE